MSNFLDLDAFVPQRRKTFQFDGRTYTIVDLLDLSYQEYLELISVEQRIATMSERDQIAELARQVHRLVPDLEERAVLKMPLRKLGMLAEFVRETIREGDSGPLAPTPDA